MIRHRRALGLVAATAAAALVLGACGSNNASTPGTSASAGGGASSDTGASGAGGGSGTSSGSETSSSAESGGASASGSGSESASSSETGSGSASGSESSPGSEAASGSTATSGGGAATSGGGAANVPAEGDWCKALKDTYGDVTGKTVQLYTSIITPEDQPYKDAFKTWEQCTGAKVNYTGDKAFEAQITVKVQAGNPPDIALFPQPGLLKQVVESSGAVKPAPALAAKNVDTYYGKDWKALGTVNDQFYGVPNSANVKSFVWYSPKYFKEAGYTVPTTWDELMALSDKIAASGKKPWCAGIASGDATGWPLTDWLEDFMLRGAGPDVYNQWITHDVKFADKRVADALAKVGSILKNPKYVNGGYGDVSTIATTTFQDGGLPILKGTCFLHRQASFYAANWPKGTKVAPDGDAYAFYLPTFDNKFGKPVLGGGEFAASFSDRPEVQSFQTFLTYPIYSNTRAKLGNFISANKGLDPKNVDTEINRLSLKLLTDPQTVFRFDASDLMPGAVGSDAEWKQLTSWVTGQDDATTLANIDAAWPAG